MDSSDIAFHNMWAFTRAEAESCSQRAVENVSPQFNMMIPELTTSQGIGMHMNTAPVATDIIEIFERHGEWREAKAARLVKTMGATSETEKQEIRARTAYQPGEEMVQYWGVVCPSSTYFRLKS